MLHRRFVAPLLLLTTLAPAAAAQLTAAQALKQFKKDLAAALAGTKLTMNSAKLECFAAMATFETKLKAGTYTIADATTLFDALQAMMGEVGAAARAAGNSMSLSATDALAGFADGGSLLGIYPAGFYPGDGGPIDIYRANVRKAQDKAIAAVVKRFAKTRKLAEKEANIGLTLVLGAPGAVRDLKFDEEGGFSFSEESPITVDLLLAVSDLGLAADGVVIVAGTANVNLGVVTVLLSGASDFPASGGIPTSVKERWGTVIDDGGMFLPEGVYMCSATQGTDGPIATGSIGLR